MSKLYLIRHAQASFLSDDYDNLSDHGHTQSRVLGDYFVKKSIQFDQVYVGPLRRHLQTYDRVKEAYMISGQDFPKAIEVEELREYVGMDSMKAVREQLVIHYPQFSTWFEEMDKQPNHRTKMKMVVSYLRLWASDTLAFEMPKEIQTFAQFRAVAEIGLQKVMRDNTKGKTIAAFSSGGCISAMLAPVLGVTDPDKVMGFNLVMLNTAISEVLFSEGRLSLQAFNTLPHLKDDMITTM